MGTFESQEYPAPVRGDVTSERIVRVASTGDCVLALNGEYYREPKLPAGTPGVNSNVSEHTSVDIVISTL